MKTRNLALCLMVFATMSIAAVVLSGALVRAQAPAASAASAPPASMLGGDAPVKPRAIAPPETAESLKAAGITVSFTPAENEPAGTLLFAVRRDPAKHYDFPPDVGATQDLWNDAVFAVTENGVRVGECTVAPEKNADGLVYAVKANAKNLAQCTLTIRDVCDYRNKQTKKISARVHKNWEIRLADFAPAANDASPQN